MTKAQRIHRDTDGTDWRVDVRNPGSSNALVVFTHPDLQRSRENRYAHYIWKGPEAQNVSGRVDPRAVLALLDDAALTGLFRRSIPLAGRPTIAGRAI